MWGKQAGVGQAEGILKMCGDSLVLGQTGCLGCELKGETAGEARSAR